MIQNEMITATVVGICCRRWNVVDVTVKIVLLQRDEEEEEE